MSDDTQRDLLLGHMALELNFINSDTLEAAKATWTKNKARPMGEILVERQAITAHTRAVLENLVQLQLSQDASERDIDEAIADATEHGNIAVLTPPEPAKQDGAPPPDGKLAPTELRFKKLKPHAQGALGQVYLARDRELRRKVALKEIKERFADNPDARSRFLLEAEITGRLEHPGVVPVYGLGAYENGRPFYAMRFIKGESMADAIKRLHADDGRSASERALDLRKLLSRFVTVCNTMQYAHDRDIVHRDIKPSNIMMGAYGETLVVDWGLAKVLGKLTGEPSGSIWEPLPSSGSSETLPGRAIGTITYMSPEQAAGRLEQVGPLSDVYSLGATMFTILTGRASVEDSMAPGQDRVDLVKMQRKVCDGDISRPRQVKSDVDRALEAICMKAMALRAGDRYPNARALGEDLEKWLANEPVSAYPEPITVRTRRFVSRHRTAVAGAAAAVLVGLFSLLAGTVYFADQNNKLNQANTDLADQKNKAELATVQATNLAGELKVTNATLTKTNDQLTASEIRLKKANANAIEAREKAIEQFHLAEKARTEAELARDERASTFALNTTMLAQSRWNEGQVVLANDMLQQVPDKFRYGGWHFLRRQFEGSYATLYGHFDTVRQVAFSPDGTLIASAGTDGKMKIWDAPTGKLLQTVSGVNVFAFSPDSQRIATNSGTGSLALRETRTGKVVASSEKLHKEEVTSIAFSPDGTHIVTGSLDGTIQQCSVAALDKSAPFNKAHMSGVTALAFSPDGKQLASTGLDKTLIVWNTATGERLQTYQRQTNGIGGVAYSPDNKLLAFVYADTAGANQAVKAWKTDALGAEVPALQVRHGADITSIAISPDGRRLASAGFDGVIKLWDATSGKELQALRGHSKVARSVNFSPDGQRLVSAGDDRTVKLWDIVSGQELQTYAEQLKAITSVAFSPADEQRLASGAWNGAVKVWNAATGEDVWTQKNAYPTEVLSVAFSHDGKRLASAGQDGKIKLWDADSGKEIALKIAGHAGGVTSVTFSKDGKRIASSGRDKAVRVWDANTGAELWSLKRGATDEASNVTSVSFSPNGDLLAWAEASGTVKVVDLRDKKEVASIPAHINGYTSVAFSPDGEVIASAGQDGRVSVWDADKGQLLVHCKGHSGGVMGVAFSSDGRRLASASKDGTIKLWDSRTGQDLKTFHGHADLVTSVAFSPDNTRIASASLDKTVKLWDATTAKALRPFTGQHLKAIVGVAFSKDGKHIISRDTSKKVVTWNVDDAKVLPSDKTPPPPDSSAAISPDGKKFALPFGSWFYVMDLDPSKADATYRTNMARIKPWWHEEQATRCEKEQAWYGAAFHRAWIAKANPSQDNRARFTAAGQKLNEREVAFLSRQAGLGK